MKADAAIEALRAGAVRTVVAAYAGGGNGAPDLNSALDRLSGSAPKGRLWLLWPSGIDVPPAARRIAGRCVRYPKPGQTRAADARARVEAERAVAALAAAVPAVAVVFTSPGGEPSGPAYLCYLAGIPYRVGFGGEFAGALLSETKPRAQADGAEAHLALLDACGFPSQRSAPAAAAAEGWH